MTARSPGESRPPAWSQTDRVEAIQWLRGVAAMIVVCHHAALLALKYLELPENSAHRMQWDLANAGVFGVDIFFVISGFVMAASARRFDGGRDAIHFLAQRYNRIAPLFYLLSALLLADMLRAQVPFECARRPEHSNFRAVVRRSRVPLADPLSRLDPCVRVRLLRRRHCADLVRRRAPASCC